MNLKIEVSSKDYNSDTIDNGRIVKSFFITLANNVFNQSYKYYEKYNEYKDMNDENDVYELPLLYNERNIYSLIAVQ